MTHPPFKKCPGFDTPHIMHGFFGRQGGVSEGIYASLNIGTGSEDLPENVSKNRALVRDAMDAEALLSAYQYHSAEVIEVTQVWADDDRPRADAMVTRVPGLALCILTADCTPVLFHDAEARIIGAAHAGWQGALGGVCEAVIAKMVEMGAIRAQIKAAIGPCIHQASYEVGPEFRDRFCENAPETARFFIAGAGDRLHFDLPAYVHARLEATKIGAIDWLAEDTCALETDYHSNRRRNQRNEADYGRNGSVILLRN